MGARPLSARPPARAGNRSERGSCPGQRQRATLHTRGSQKPHSPSTIPAVARVTSKDISSQHAAALSPQRAPAASSAPTLHHITSCLGRPDESPEHRGAIGYKRLGDKGECGCSRHLWAGQRQLPVRPAPRPLTRPAPCTPTSGLSLTRGLLDRRTHLGRHVVPFRLLLSTFSGEFYNSAPSGGLQGPLGNRRRFRSISPDVRLLVELVSLLPERQWFFLEPACRHLLAQRNARAGVCSIKRKYSLILI